MQITTYELIPPETAAEILKDVLESDKWETGVTGKPSMTGTIKINRELKHMKCEIASPHLFELRDALQTNEDVKGDALMHKVLTPKFNRHGVGEQYKRHTDHDTIGKVRTDLACTVFLTPPEEYEGGDLVIYPSSGEDIVIKASPGTCVVYPCWFPHQVTPVTRGERISAVTWIESFIRDEEKRQLIRLLDKCGGRLEAEGHLEAVTITAAVHKLLRMWKTT